MKNLRKFLFALAALAAVFTFASCSDDDDDDDDSGSATITLPESVGTNELSGSSWKQSDSDYSRTFEFADGTATLTEVDAEDSSTTIKRVYKYTYDSENKLVYLALTTYGGTDSGESYSISASSYESQVKNMGDSGDHLSWDIEWAKNLFTTPTIYKYTLDGSSLTLANYFDGTLPSNSYFYNKNDTNLDYDGYLQTYDSSSEANYALFPTFSNGSFSGNLYKEGYDDGNYKKLGTASGTYTVSGTGTSDCTITFTFTSLPNEFSVITTNTAYKLTQDEDSYKYTKVTN